MKFGRLILLGAFALGASASAEAATPAPRLYGTHIAKPVTLTVKDKKKHHAHVAHKKAVAQAHKVKKVKRHKKVSNG